MQFIFRYLGHPMNAPVLTVTQLTNAIKHSLESTFPLVWLQGEISNFKQQTSGHLYFSLKDANAQISAVMFRGDAATLALMPKGGEQVLVCGELNVYPAKGNYQLIVRELSYAGVGELLLKLEQLKIKLHKMGWFSKVHKKPLPKFPKRIGVVTSPTGAVIQDILNVLSRRFSGFQLILNPVKVQGEGAAQEIAKAIADFNTYQLADVLIVGRGGGSLEDLWAFNEEIVAEAIFNSRIPIISAVGHETDHCIADYVADVRAPTPSAAAEIVIAEKAQQLHHLQQIQHRLQQSLTHQVKHNRQKLKGVMRHPFFITPDALLGESFQRMDHLREDLDLAMRLSLQNRRLRLQSSQKQLESLKPTTQLIHSRQRLLSIHKHLNILGVKALSLRRERLENLVNGLHSIDPKNVLQRGYSILLSKDHHVISSVAALQVDQQVQILLSDGEAVAKIEAVP
jgi:exodeoxyribonuclease VII large subunit